jgi:hypothetical protein
MLRLVAALAVLFLATMGALWVLDIVSPTTAQDLMTQGGAVLVILAAAGAALSALAPSSKPEAWKE